MTAFRTLLIVIFSVIAIYTAPVVLDHGINLSLILPDVGIASFNFIVESAAVCHGEIQMAVIHDE